MKSNLNHNLWHKWVLLLLFLFSMVGTTSTAIAETRSIFLNQLPSENQYLKHVTVDVYIVTLKGISTVTETETGTFVAEFLLDEVLRGDTQSQTLKLEWRPSNLTFISQESLVVFVNTFQTIPIILDAYRFSPEIKDKIVANITIEDVNFIVLLVLLTIPFVSLQLGFSIIDRPKPQSSFQMIRRRAILIISMLISYASYLAVVTYNESMPIDYNIRVDLLIIYPTLFVAGVNFIIALLVLILSFKRSTSP